MKLKFLIKYIVFRFTPHLIFDTFHYLFAKVDMNLRKQILGKDSIYVFGGCDYGNLGDYAITLAQSLLLKDLYPNKSVHVIAMNKTYEGIKTVLKFANRNDLVTIIGGGNMGELYYGYERKRNFIVHKLQDYKIVSFPQSMVWGENILSSLGLKRSSREYSRHNNLLLLAREMQSYDKMKSAFPFNKVRLCPDIVLTLDEREKVVKRKGIVITIRNDYESFLSESDKTALFNVLDKTGLSITNLDTGSINGQSLETSLKSLFNAYCHAELVITDRLHGMIFAYITGTPAIVFPNNNGKIEFSYKWIADCSYIKLIQKRDLRALPILIEELRNVKVDNDKFVNKRAEFIDYYRTMLL